MNISAGSGGLLEKTTDRSVATMDNGGSGWIERRKDGCVVMPTSWVDRLLFGVVEIAATIMDLRRSTEKHDLNGRDLIGSWLFANTPSTK